MYFPRFLIFIKLRYTFRLKNRICPMPYKENRNISCLLLKDRLIKSKMRVILLYIIRRMFSPLYGFMDFIFILSCSSLSNLYVDCFFCMLKSFSNRMPSVCNVNTLSLVTNFAICKSIKYLS